MAAVGGDEVEQFNAQVLYREWGRRFTVLQKFLKGIYYYKKSTEFGDENFLWTLLGLAEALKKSGQFKEAAEVAEKCMNIDPSHLGAYYTRMEALYDVAEFCMSLVYAQRGARRRSSFKPAVLLANGTVDDCVGKRVPPDTLRKLYPWIYSLERHRDEAKKRLLDEEDEFDGIDEEQMRFKINDPDSRLRRHRAKLDRLLAALYLGASCDDKFFLGDMIHLPALNSANKASGAKLMTATKDCLKRQQSQQEALRMRRPLYALKARLEALQTCGMKIEACQELMLKSCLANQLARFMLRKIHEARLARDYPLFFQLVERAKVNLDSWSLRLCPQRDRYLNALYQMVARAYLDPRNVARFADEDKKIAYIRRSLGLKGPRLPRDEYLAWPPNLNLRRAVLACRDRLALTKNPFEMLWLFHELCKLKLEKKRFDMARFYSKKLRDLGEEMGLEEWVLNATHVLVRIELAQNNRAEAKDACTVCIESARKLGSCVLMDFYERAIDFIDSLDFSARLSDDDSIAARQKLIISLAPVELRPETSLLLRAIDAVKPNRRLSVMPGCKPKPRKDGLVSSKKTIMAKPVPNFEKEVNRSLLKKFSPSKTVLGQIDFSLYD
ncbi:hypothetical protein QAD02_001632 [Eretmocerus hayati]|uniref:Uncharacterized protein n=1 Tax=Eretmocerus hayati TaxID=131215 RepID=A0ACC2NGQ3_9HYME|nr:hypothetical protein QAD02_001632 [Eretmocerus hayati]